MATSMLGTTRNLSFYCVPAAWILAVTPHMYAIISGKLRGRYDNTEPRTYVKSLEHDQTIDAATRGRLVRAAAAGLNGIENMGLFAAAIVAGNIAKLDTDTLNLLSVGYLATRVLYNYLYITNTTQIAANTRSTVFFAGIGLIFTLFIKSGNALHNRL